MKYFALSALALTMTVAASASSIDTFLCGSATNQGGGGFNPSTITCTTPTLSSLGAVDIDSVAFSFAGSYDGGSVGQTNTVSESISTTTNNLTGGSGLGSGPFSWTETNFASSITSGTTASGGYASNPVTYTYTSPTTSNPGTVVFTPADTVTNGGVNNVYAQVYETVTYDTSSAPEPGSMMLLGGGLLAAGLIGRKKLVRK